MILKRGQNVKHAPLAFTEHGALMADRTSDVHSTRGDFEDVGREIEKLVRLGPAQARGSERPGRRVEAACDGGEALLYRVQLVAPPGFVRAAGEHGAIACGTFRRAVRSGAQSP